MAIAVPIAFGIRSNLRILFVHIEWVSPGQDYEKIKGLFWFTDILKQLMTLEVNIMSDLHIEICEAVEKILCEELSMESCERTYEIAAQIVEAVFEKEDQLKRGDLNV